MCSVVASRAEDPACNFAGAYSSVHHQLSQTADLLRASDYVCEQANQILAPFAETGASMVIQGAAVAYFYIVLRGVHDISKWKQADDEAAVERRRKAGETVRLRPNSTVAKVRKRLEVLANKVFPSYRDIGPSGCTHQTRQLLPRLVLVGSARTGVKGGLRYGHRGASLRRKPEAHLSSSTLKLQPNF